MEMETYEEAYKMVYDSVQIMSDEEINKMFGE